MNALEIRNLNKSFPGFQLENLNLTLPSGCILGLVGENGAGKSTTIKLILGMLQPDGGSITVLGNTRLDKEDIGVVPDEVGLPRCLDARQIGRIMAGIYKNWEPQAYRALLQKLAVPENKPFKDLSKGMKMKLGIAIALSHGAKLLLLDEATSGLDPVARDQVLELLEEFTRDENHAVLISSHIVSDLEKLCDYIAFLHQGKLMLCEEKDVLLSKYGIVRCEAAVLDELDKSAILHRKDTRYGSEALVLRTAVPGELPVSLISIEELFVYMVKEAN